MAQAQCSLHGQVEATWKEGGVSKAGKPFNGFWKCPYNARQPDGTFPKCRMTMPNNPTGKFNQEIDKAAAIMDHSQEGRQKGRCAIACALIQRGTTWGLEASIEAKAWEDWMLTGKTFVSPPQPPVISYDEPGMDILPY